MYFAQTLNATSGNPTIFQTVASDDFIHGSNISVLGLSDNAAATVKVDAAKLNALQTRGPIKTGTTLIGLGGSTTVERYSATTPAVAGLAVTVTAGFSDSTRGGGTFTIGACQQ